MKIKQNAFLKNRNKKQRQWLNESDWTIKTNDTTRSQAKVSGSHLLPKAKVINVEQLADLNGSPLKHNRLNEGESIRSVT